MNAIASPHDWRYATMLAGIAVVLLAGLALGNLARRLHQPAVVGEIAAGILLGPSILGHLPGNVPELVFPADVRPLLSAVAQVGLILFMFLVGCEFERRLVADHAPLAAGVSLSSIVLAFGLGVAAAALLHPHHKVVAGQEVPFIAFATFIGAAMSVTAFPVLARILTDKKLLSTRIGSLAMASAAVDDVLAWCLLAYVSALVTADGDHIDLVQTAVRSAIYALAMFFLIRPLLGRLVGDLAARGRWDALLALLCSGAFLSAWLTTWIGIHAIFGAFLFGAITPRRPREILATHVRQPINHISLILMPVFFIVTGLGVDVGALSAWDLLELALILVAACAGKVVGALLPARAAGLSWRDARTLGILMNTRGLTELIILNAAASLGILDDRMFTMMVIMALVTTAIAGPLVPHRPKTDTTPPAAPPIKPRRVLSRSSGVTGSSEQNRS
jgi:Kef-type K+ transport system membrane component KefB